MDDATHQYDIAGEKYDETVKGERGVLRLSESLVYDPQANIGRGIDNETIVRTPLPQAASSLRLGAVPPFAREQFVATTSSHDLHGARQKEQLPVLEENSRYSMDSTRSSLGLVPDDLMADLSQISWLQPSDYISKPMDRLVQETGNNIVPPHQWPPMENYPWQTAHTLNSDDADHSAAPRSDEHEVSSRVGMTTAVDADFETCVSSFSVQPQEDGQIETSDSETTFQRLQENLPRKHPDENVAPRVPLSDSAIEDIHRLPMLRRVFSETSSFRLHGGAAIEDEEEDEEGSQSVVEIRLDDEELGRFNDTFSDIGQNDTMTGDDEEEVFESLPVGTDMESVGHTNMISPDSQSNSEPLKVETRTIAASHKDCRLADILRTTDKITLKTSTAEPDAARLAVNCQSDCRQDDNSCSVSSTPHRHSARDPETSGMVWKDLGTETTPAWCQIVPRIVDATSCLSMRYFMPSDMPVDTTVVDSSMLFRESLAFGSSISARQSEVGTSGDSVEANDDPLSSGGPIFQNSEGEWVTNLAYRPSDGFGQLNFDDFDTGTPNISLISTPRSPTFITNEISAHAPQDFEMPENDFKSASMCLEMLAEDEKNFETKEPNFYLTEEMVKFAASHNLSSDRWSICSHISVADPDASTAYMRLSFGEFAKRRSDQLGALDGASLSASERPIFGTNPVSSPEYNRTPKTVQNSPPILGDQDLTPVPHIQLDNISDDPGNGPSMTPDRTLTMLDLSSPGATHTSKLPSSRTSSTEQTSQHQLCPDDALHRTQRPNGKSIVHVSPINKESVLAKTSVNGRSKSIGVDIGDDAGQNARSLDVGMNGHSKGTGLNEKDTAASNQAIDIINESSSSDIDMHGSNEFATGGAVELTTVKVNLPTVSPQNSCQSGQKLVEIPRRSVDCPIEESQGFDLSAAVKMISTAGASNNRDHLAQVLKDLSKKRSSYAPLDRMQGVFTQGTQNHSIQLSMVEREKSKQPSIAAQDDRRESSDLMLHRKTTSTFSVRPIKPIAVQGAITGDVSCAQTDCKSVSSVGGRGSLESTRMKALEVNKVVKQITDERKNEATTELKLPFDVCSNEAASCVKLSSNSRRNEAMTHVKLAFDETKNKAMAKETRSDNNPRSNGPDEISLTQKETAHSASNIMRNPNEIMSHSKINASLGDNSSGAILTARIDNQQSLSNQADSQLTRIKGTSESVIQQTQIEPTQSTVSLGQKILDHDMNVSDHGVDSRAVSESLMKRITNGMSGKNAASRRSAASDTSLHAVTVAGLARNNSNKENDQNVRNIASNLLLEAQTRSIDDKSKDMRNRSAVIVPNGTHSSRATVARNMDVTSKDHIFAVTSSSHQTMTTGNKPKSSAVLADRPFALRSVLAQSPKQSTVTSQNNKHSGENGILSVEDAWTEANAVAESNIIFKSPRASVYACSRDALRELTSTTLNATLFQSFDARDAAPMQGTASQVTCGVANVTARPQEGSSSSGTICNPQLSASAAVPNGHSSVRGISQAGVSHHKMARGGINPAFHGSSNKISRAVGAAMSQPTGFSGILATNAGLSPSPARDKLSLVAASESQHARYKDGQSEQASSSYADSRQPLANQMRATGSLPSDLNRGGGSRQPNRPTSQTYDNVHRGSVGTLSNLPQTGTRNVSVPSNVDIASVCIVGIPVFLMIPVRNDNRCKARVSIYLTSASVDGRTLDHTLAKSTFIIDTEHTIPAKGSTETSPKVLFLASDPGHYIAQFELAMIHPQPNLQPIRMQFTMQVDALDARVEILQPMSDDTLDFGYLPWDHKRFHYLMLVNHSPVDLPVRLIIQSDSHLGQQFWFIKVPTTAGDLNSTIANDERSFSSEYQTILPSSASSCSSGDAAVRVLVVFRAPPPSRSTPSVQPFHAVVHMVLCPSLTNAYPGVVPRETRLPYSVSLVGKVGNARLTVPANLNVLTLKSDDPFIMIPLRNSGAIPLDVALEVLGHDDLFVLSQDQFVIECGKEAVVGVRFVCGRERVRRDSVLLICVLPDGPNYEISLIGVPQPSIHDFSILTSKSCLYFGGLPIGQSAIQTVLIRGRGGPAKEMKIRLEVQGSEDFKIRYGGGTRHEKLLTVCEKLVEPGGGDQTIDICYTALRCNESEGKLSVIVVATSKKHTIQLSGYGGRAEVLLDAVPLEAEGCYILCATPRTIGIQYARGRREFSSVVTLRNCGTRSSYICAVPYSDRLCKQQLADTISVELLPAKFCFGPDCTQDVVIRVACSANSVVEGDTFSAFVAFHYGDELAHARLRAAVAAGAIIPQSYNLQNINFNNFFEHETTVTQVNVGQFANHFVEHFYRSAKRLRLEITCRLDTPSFTRASPQFTVMQEDTDTEKQFGGNIAYSMASTTTSSTASLGFCTSHISVMARSNASSKASAVMSRAQSPPIRLLNSISQADEKRVEEKRGQHRRCNSCANLYQMTGTVRSSLDDGSSNRTSDLVGQSIRRQEGNGTTADAMRCGDNNASARGAAGTAREGVMVNGMRRGSSSRALGTMANVQIIVFGETVCDSFAEATLELKGARNGSMSWSIVESTPTYVRCGNGRESRALAAFSVHQESGIIHASQVYRMLIRFEPHEVGDFRQDWQLNFTAASSNDSDYSVKVELRGRGVARPDNQQPVLRTTAQPIVSLQPTSQSAGLIEQLAVQQLVHLQQSLQLQGQQMQEIKQQLGLGAATPRSSFSDESMARSQRSNRSRHFSRGSTSSSSSSMMWMSDSGPLMVNPCSLTFVKPLPNEPGRNESVQEGDWTEQKIKLSNKAEFDLDIQVPFIEHPFRIKRSTITVKSKCYIRLPVKFIATGIIGRCESCLVLKSSPCLTADMDSAARSENSQSITVQLLAIID